MAYNLPGVPYSDGIAKQTSVSFGGIDLRPSNNGSGAAWMINMKSDDYPLLSSRDKRVIFSSFTDGTALASYDGLIYVRGTSLYYNGTAVLTVTAGAKKITALGVYIIVFPDKKYYKTSDGTTGSLGASWSGSVTFGDGTLYDEAAEANTITTTGTAFPFEVGDAVTISGCATLTSNNKTPIIREMSDDKLTMRFYENIFDLGTENNVTIERTVPDMDFIFAHENRLWGCKGDTIYCSYLGNPFNFNVFDGLATDSFAVDVGSAGDFTGACSYLGYPTFFKEEYIYKVYGSKPSNYQVINSATLGIEAGSENSTAIAGEVLYYKSRAGFMAYTGGIPENISAVFGNEKYTGCMGGSDGNKYYVSCKDSSDDWHLFVFDPASSLWYREDASHALGFAYSSGLYMLTGEGLFIISGGEGTKESSVGWEYETGDFTENDANRKGISKIQIRMRVTGTASIYIKYDSSDNWTNVKTISTAVKKSYYLPIIPRRCDHFRIKFAGTGEFTLHSLVRESYSGSELH